jgi:hypothetical protein
MYSAGLFWASEGAVALGYPEPTKRGKYMKSVFFSLLVFLIMDDYFADLTSIWLWFRTGGPLLGGAIVLGLNQYVWLYRYRMVLKERC